jgi:hypothetical protein
MRPALRDARLPDLEMADKDRIGGWRQLYNALVRTCNARKQKVAHALDGPILLVSAECAELVKAIPQLICDEDRPEDILKTECIEDDYCDTFRYGYKSMLNAQWQAPREVRARELLDSIPGDDGEAATRRAMAMRQFNVANPARPRLGRQRWRQANDF